jgi:hypothetical protein
MKQLKGKKLILGVLSDIMLCVIHDATVENTLNITKLNLQSI